MSVSWHVWHLYICLSYHVDIHCMANVDFPLIFLFRVSFGEHCRTWATQHGRNVFTTKTVKSTCRRATDANIVAYRNAWPWECHDQVRAVGQHR